MCIMAEMLLAWCILRRCTLLAQCMIYWCSSPLYMVYVGAVHASCMRRIIEEMLLACCLLWQSLLLVWCMLWRRMLLTQFILYFFFHLHGTCCSGAFNFTCMWHSSAQLFLQFKVCRLINGLNVIELATKWFTWCVTNLKFDNKSNKNNNDNNTLLRRYVALITS